MRGRKELTKGERDLAKEDAMKFDKILVPLDGSLIAEAALPRPEAARRVIHVRAAAASAGCSGEGDDRD